MNNKNDIETIKNLTFLDIYEGMHSIILKSYMVLDILV